MVLFWCSVVSEWITNPSVDSPSILHLRYQLVLPSFLTGISSSTFGSVPSCCCRLLHCCYGGWGRDGGVSYCCCGVGGGEGVGSTKNRRNKLSFYTPSNYPRFVVCNLYFEAYLEEIGDSLLRFAREDPPGTLIVNSNSPLMVVTLSKNLIRLGRSGSPIDEAPMIHHGCSGFAIDEALVILHGCSSFAIDGLQELGPNNSDTKC